MHGCSLELLEAVLINTDAAAAQLLVRAGVIGKRSPSQGVCHGLCGALCRTSRILSGDCRFHVPSCYVSSVGAGHSALNRCPGLLAGTYCMLCMLVCCAGQCADVFHMHEPKRCLTRVGCALPQMLRRRWSQGTSGRYSSTSQAMAALLQTISWARKRGRAASACIRDAQLCDFCK